MSQGAQEGLVLDLKYKDGYRRGVGIIVCNVQGQVLWARRTRHDGWQFPQGGVEGRETVEAAAFRELYEEVGLQPVHVRMAGRTREWLHYDVPKRYTATSRVTFLGQKQIWFLMQLVGKDGDVCLNRVAEPEFDKWCWVDYWEPAERIVAFKRDVYRQALRELEPFLPQHSVGRSH